MLHRRTVRESTLARRRERGLSTSQEGFGYQPVAPVATAFDGLAIEFPPPPGQVLLCRDRWRLGVRWRPNRILPC
jgi:hypothetical protein